MSSLTLSADVLARHTDWQSSVIIKTNMSDEQKENADGRQQELLAVARDGPDATHRYLRRELGDKAPDDAELPNLTTERTVAEMGTPPVEVEVAWHRDLGGATLGRNLASEPAFWTLCHAKWINQGRFGRDVFTVFCDGGTNTSENYVRNFLRRTSGLHAARGSVSVLNDCLVSRGWWRTELATEIHRTLERERAVANAAPSASQVPVPALSREDIHRILWPSFVWPPLVGELVKRVASVNAPRARAAVVAALANRGVPDVRVTSRELLSSVAALGQLAHSYSLHTAPWEQLANTAVDGLDNPPERSPDDDADADDAPVSDAV